MARPDVPTGSRRARSGSPGSYARALSAFGAEAYPSFDEKVAAPLHSIARNHALVDGNKGLAWAAGRVFCLLNGRDLAMGVDEAEALVVGAASGTLDVPRLREIVGRRLRDV